MTHFDRRTHGHDPVRLELLGVAEEAVAAVQPGEAIARAVLRDDDLLHIGSLRLALSNYKRAVILGFGKASVPMARATLRLLDGIPSTGVLVTTAREPVEGLTVIQGTHPVPREGSVEGGRLILEAAAIVGRHDLAIVLISGGGSSLLCAPTTGLTLDDLQTTHNLLLRSGATIREVNTVRKHLSAVKGGRLGERLSGAGAVVTLILSDVTGNPLDVIAAGPMVADPTTFADSLWVLDRFHLRGRVPTAVLKHLEAGASGMVPETPKEDVLGDRQTILVVADAVTAAKAAANSARYLPGPAYVVTTELEGEAREVAADLIEEAEGIAVGETLIYAGETTVTVNGDGVGGRNQELALAASIELTGRDDIVVLSFGTDGIDGSTQAAGGFADGTAVQRGRQLGLDAIEHLQRNDSNTFLTAVGDTVTSGPTQTNVGDLILVRRYR